MLNFKEINHFFLFYRPDGKIQSLNVSEQVIYFKYFSALLKNSYRNMMMHFEQQQQAWSNYCYSIMQMNSMLTPNPVSRRTAEQGVIMALKKEEHSNFYYLIFETKITFCFSKIARFFQKPFFFFEFIFMKKYFFFFLVVFIYLNGTIDLKSLFFDRF